MLMVVRSCLVINSWILNGTSLMSLFKVDCFMNVVLYFACIHRSLPPVLTHPSIVLMILIVITINHRGMGYKELPLYSAHDTDRYNDQPQRNGV